ncbi:hypothetical protein [Flavobacterium cerinum]|uniref:DUF3139 domain-containing protein n=1 Tax=Flavobacterium cerinum TaxID=2502784 RepID=A0ABY5IUP2_9FLAO|nr:hypothetical protein [Flavobacterium cerinum]UUC46495.1 hypothetical protein NOX80_04665 [Flavobacterium cerinum]
MRKGVIISLFLFVIFLYFYNNFFASKMILGTYVNRNYNQSHSIAEIPNVADTLVILKDNKFISQYWGEGSYELYYTIKGTEIDLMYDYEFGKAGFRTSIDRIMYFGGLKIDLFRDLNQYYEKIY